MVRLKRKLIGSKLKAFRRAEWIASKGSKCNYCGTLEGPFDVDHCIPKWFTNDKPNQVIWHLSKAKREIELAKCQVLCKPCHKAKTAIEHLAIRYKKQMMNNE